MALCYFNIDPLAKAGLVHGVSSPEVARKLPVATGILIVVLNAGIFFVSVRSILGAL